METSQEQAGKGNNICLVIDLHAGQISLRQTSTEISELQPANIKSSQPRMHELNDYCNYIKNCI